MRDKGWGWFAAHVPSLSQDELVDLLLRGEASAVCTRITEQRLKGKPGYAAPCARRLTWDWLRNKKELEFY